MAQSAGGDGTDDVAFGGEHEGLPTQGAATPSPARRALLLGVPILAIAIAAVVLATGCGTSGDFTARAAAVCSNAQRALEELPQSPTSIAEGLEVEHAALAIFKREVSELEALAPRASAPFRAGLADDQQLLSAFSSILARPDFVQLSLTLPDHPDLAPTWLKEWLARSRALQSDAHTQFAQAGIPACEKSLG